MARSFSGKNSEELWDRINGLANSKKKKLVKNIGDILYLFGCDCQNLEARVERLEKKKVPSKQPVNAVKDLFLLCQRIARSKTSEERTKLLYHATRIAEQAGYHPSILRDGGESES